MSVRSPARATPTPTTRFDIAPRTVIIGFAIVAGCWLLRELWSIAVLVMVALMLVGTLAPVVNALERRGLRRGLALILVFVGLFAAFAGVLLLTIPPLIGQLLTVLGNAPQRRDSLVQWLESHRMLAPLAGMVKDVDLTAVTGRAGGQLVSYSSRLAVILGYALTTVFLAFYLLADGKRAKGGLFALPDGDLRLQSRQPDRLAEQDQRPLRLDRPWIRQHGQHRQRPQPAQHHRRSGHGP